MNFEYTIENNPEYNQYLFIKIQEKKLEALQDLLNTICEYTYVEEIISEFKTIQDFFPELDDLVVDKYVDYWYDDLVGKCFTILGYDNGIDVFMSGSTVYIQNQYQYPKVPRVKFNIDEFIKILKEWRDILRARPN